MLTIKNSFKAAGIAAFALFLCMLPGDGWTQAVNLQPAPSNGVLIFGTSPVVDGLKARRVNVDANGNLTAAVTGTVTALDPVCTAWETYQYAIPATGLQFAVGTLASRDWLRVTNSSASASAVFCGKTGLTTSTGERLDVSEGRPFRTGTTQLYCLTTAPGTATLTTFECDQ